MASHVSVAGGKHAALLVCFGLIVAGVSGCGSSGKLTPTSKSQSPIAASLPGNWEFTLTTGITTDTMPIGAYLTSTGTAVTGTANVQMAFPTDCAAGCCGGPFAQFSNALTGTLTNAGVLTLTSTVPNGGPVFTMTGTMSGATFTNGTFNLTGGCPASGTITGVLLPSLDGTYTGTVTSTETGQSYSLSTSLEQSTTLNTLGFFNVSGSATFTGYACLPSATIPTPLASYSGFLGNQFEVSMNGVNGGTLNLSGALSPDGKTLTVQYGTIGGSCHNDVGNGTLILQ